MLRGRCIPTFDRLAVRNPIEGVIDLAGRESLRVERQHFRGRKFLRIKSPSPFGILESGSTDPRGHTRRIQESGVRIQNSVGPSTAAHRAASQMTWIRLTISDPIPPNSVSWILTPLFSILCSVLSFRYPVSYATRTASPCVPFINLLYRHHKRALGWRHWHRSRSSRQDKLPAK
jgi:hypothetical protein